MTNERMKNNVIIEIGDLCFTSFRELMAVANILKRAKTMSARSHSSGAAKPNTYTAHPSAASGIRRRRIVSFT